MDDYNKNQILHRAIALSHGNQCFNNLENYLNTVFGLQLMHITYVSSMWKQITYFDRLQREKQQVPRTIPLTSVWKKNRIKKRMEIEMKRGYGKGIVLDRIPIEQSKKDSIEEEECTQSSAEDTIAVRKKNYIRMHNLTSLFINEHRV